MRSFDAIVIGAGQAGPFLAARLAEAGRKVALVERKFLGGTCVNAGCMPTKTLVASAHAARMVQRAAEFGIVTQGASSVDMAKVRDRAASVTHNARQGLEDWLGGIDNLTLLRGQARFEDARTVIVNGERLQAPQIYINVGARPTIPDYPGLADIPYLTSTSILQLDTLPRHLVIVGGSYIGLEFAQMYRRFGAQVTVIERGERIASREDADISDAIAGILSAEGIDIRTGTGDLRFATDGADIEIVAGGETLYASHVLVATGRTPNTDDLELEAAGVTCDARGYITVDDRLQTNVKGLWALGDCNGRGAFTHTSYNDFEIAAANLLDGEDRKVSDRILGYALYIDPPLGRVGMSERAARASGRPLLVSVRPMSAVGRAVEKDETQGFMKLVADASSGQILGAAILGTGGDEAIHGILDAMNAKTSHHALKWAVPIHPTVSEQVPTLIGGLQPV
ncbi:FAD-containing oxidoreductase [Rhizobium halophytocola]|uniref:Pyruvate/2-oxoglutarate dehydrogenase complex dihydrolipoamide dehydrogenase (E3) component n=1 Tax=Rhizobium halophytocola TaxID=735519 RepID=A0ABS4DWR1_9HYPH|nr:FAD-containing oxidoreductase [Rhizobium halophytocola]MBP1850123.1 pyruvate/2-oxoglutarate dehydrogenase complex dihydrolipoamide dehydrogenase (E3) component [Rhizobium halophytocola]